MQNYHHLSCLLSLLQCLIYSSEAFLPLSPSLVSMDRLENGSTKIIFESAQDRTNHFSRRVGNNSYRISRTSLAASGDEQVQWELYRFIRQSSKFVTFPSLPFAKRSIQRKIRVGEFIPFFLKKTQSASIAS